MARVINPRELLSRSSLRVAEQWQMWLGHNLDAMPYENGQERLLRDTAIICMHNTLNCARRLRKNPGWGIGGTMRDDTVNLHAEMLEAQRVYKMNRPKLPAFAQLAPLYDLMDGLVNQQVRLAREVQELHDTGAIDLRVTTDAATGRIIEQLHN